MMHPIIRTEVEKILQGPLEDMIPQWEQLNHKYAKPMELKTHDEEDIEESENTSNYTKEYLKYISPPSISLEEAVEILTSIGEKIFTRQISLNRPELVLDFVNEFWGYLKSEQVTNLIENNIYKDALAIDLYQSILNGKTHPDADPYFKIDPEHPMLITLSHGVTRGLFTQADVKTALDNQDKTSKLYVKISELNSRIYDSDHIPFGTCGKKEPKQYEDYGCHVFIGRMYSDINSLETDEYTYAALSHSVVNGMGDNLETVAKNLWRAVRRNQKVLLSKSPGDRFKPLSNEELFAVYELYISNPNHKLLPDPFLNQPE